MALPLEKLVEVPLEQIPRYVGGYVLGKVHYHDDDGVQRTEQLHPAFLVYLSELGKSPRWPTSEKEKHWLQVLAAMQLVGADAEKGVYLTHRAKHAKYDLFPYDE